MKIYDADTLKQWKDMLGSEVDRLMLKTLEFELAALSSFTLTEEEEQRLSQTSQLAKEMGLPLPGRYAKDNGSFDGTTGAGDLDCTSAAGNDSILYAASVKGHDQVLQTLPHKGVDVDVQGGYYSNTLQAASEGGHDEVVRILLENEADVNAQGGLCGNALQINIILRP